MSESIGQPAWMKKPETRAVMDALAAKGGADCARFVGGCVRNTIMRRPVDDIDIATTLTPDEVTQALEAAGLRAVPTGVEHGTVTAISNHKPYEITTLRRDVETDGRRAVVAFTTDWREDAERRDFRLNALYADGEGAVFEPVEGGIADARAGRIVFVGDPEQRIREDYLRILRFFRFHAWYGKGEPDAAALAACAKLKEGMGSLAAERISKELLKLLAADDPRASIRLMAATGILRQVLPQAASLARFEALVAIETEQLFENDAELRLAALLPDHVEAAHQAADALRLSNAQRERLVGALSESPHRIVSYLSPKEARQRVYGLGRQAFSDRVKLAWAASAKAASQWRALLMLGQTWTAPTFPISGDEIMAAGVPKGPLVGEVRREVEAWWIDNDFIDDKLSIVERLKAVAQGLAY